jgi:hypothetical protein
MKCVHRSTRVNDTVRAPDCEVPPLVKILCRQNEGGAFLSADRLSIRLGGTTTRRGSLPLHVGPSLTEYQS